MSRWPQSLRTSSATWKEQWFSILCLPSNWITSWGGSLLNISRCREFICSPPLWTWTLMYLYFLTAVLRLLIQFCFHGRVRWARCCAPSTSRWCCLWPGSTASKSRSEPLHVPPSLTQDSRNVWLPLQISITVLLEFLNSQITILNIFSSLWKIILLGTILSLLSYLQGVLNFNK